MTAHLLVGLYAVGRFPGARSADSVWYYAYLQWPTISLILDTLLPHLLVLRLGAPVRRHRSLSARSPAHLEHRRRLHP
jgi:hypothetical protein